jgi:hypothetical protein
MRTEKEKRKHARYMREYRKRNPDKKKKADRKYYLSHKPEHNTHSRLYNKRHPLKRRAHHKISNAIRDGKLKRPKYCSDCKGALKIEAHHPNYLKLTTIVWLCQRCHRKLHNS